MLDFFNYKQSNFKLTIDQQRLKWFKEFLKPFLVVTIVYATMYLVRNNFKAAQPFMKEELGFTTTDLGYIGLGFSLSYGIGRSLLGYFFDGRNTKKIISALLVLSGFIAIAIGFLLAVEGRSLGFLIVLWTLNGLAQSTGGPCSYSTIIRWTPIANRAKYLGWFNISHNVGGALAGVLALWAANVFFDGHVWGMFIVPGLVVCVVGVITLFIGKGDPKEAGFDVPAKIFNEPVLEEEKRSINMTKWQIFKTFVLKNPFVWILCINNLCIYVLRIGVDNWAPLYVSESLNFSGQAAVNTIMFFEVGGLFGSIAWGYVCDFMKGRSALLSMILVFIMGFVILGYQFGRTELVINTFLFLAGFVIFGPILLSSVSVVRLAPRGAVTVTSALPGTFGYIFGDSLAKVLIARIADPQKDGFNIFGHNLHGWGDTFTVFYVACFISIALMSLVAINEERQIRRAAALAKEQPED